MGKWTEKAKQRQRDRIAELRAAGICNYCKRKKATRGNLCDGCFQQRSERARGRLLEIRRAVLARYGKICACCGEAEEGFLTIDHINNDGWKERLGGNGFPTSAEMICRKLVYGPKRDDIQILCYNCNCARQRLGYCPHRPETKIERRVRGARRRDGEHNPQARLTRYQVSRIRASNETYAELGRRFGISDVAVRLVKLGISYKRMPSEEDVAKVGALA